MSLYVLDTDMVTLLLHGEPNVCERAAQLDPADVVVTIIPVEEVLSGWDSQIRRAKKDDKLVLAYQALQEAVEFFGRIRVVPLDSKALQQFRIWQKAKTGVGSNDLKIAAIVQKNDAILVTRNVRDFEKLPDMKIEDWA